MKITLFLFSFFVCIGAVYAQKRLISGEVHDVATKEMIPFAHVILKQQKIGSICTEGGKFEFYIPENTIKDTLEVSCLGYKTSYVLLDNASYYKIPLTAEVSILPEISLQDDLGKKILLEAIKRIPENYHYFDKPAVYTIHHKEEAFRDSLPYMYQEWVIDTYKNKNNKLPPIQIQKVRAKAHTEEAKQDLHEHRVFRLQNGYFIDERAGNEFLNKHKTIVTLEDTKIFEGDSIWVLHIETNRWQGKIATVEVHITQKDYAFMAYIYRKKSNEEGYSANGYYYKKGLHGKWYFYQQIMEWHSNKIVKKSISQVIAIRDTDSPISPIRDDTEGTKVTDFLTTVIKPFADSFWQKYEFIKPYQPPTDEK